MRYGDSPYGAVEGQLTEFFGEVRAVERAPVDLWERIAPELGSAPPTATAGASATKRRWLRRRWLAPAAVVLVLGAVALVAMLSSLGGSHVASAEEILQRAETAAASPQNAGIQSLATTQRTVTYFLGDGRAGEPSQELTYRVWYEAPNRLRTEAEGTSYSLAGDAPTLDAQTAVWDGTSIWNYDDGNSSVRVLQQDPDRDTFNQAFLLGPSGGELAAYLREAALCRSVRKLDVEEVAGRPADVIELGRASCGLVFPGTDGKRLLWIDRSTGLVLRTEQYAVDGRIFFRNETTTVEINEPIASSLFRFDPPPGAEVRDDRDQPLGIGYSTRVPTPALTSLGAAREEATFPIRAPAFVPQGFTLESVQLWWGSETARELRSHADWLLLRYGDADGNWVEISQGFGDFLSGVATTVPNGATQGTVEVEGTPVTWIDGNPNAHWEPGTMLMLTWHAGRIGDGWEVLPSGETTYGSPLTVGIASNVLTLEQLVQVAESLE